MQGCDYRPGPQLLLAVRVQNLTAPSASLALNPLASCSASLLGSWWAEKTQSYQEHLQVPMTQEEENFTDFEAPGELSLTLHNREVIKCDICPQLQREGNDRFPEHF